MTITETAAHYTALCLRANRLETALVALQFVEAHDLDALAGDAAFAVCDASSLVKRELRAVEAEIARFDAAAA